MSLQITLIYIYIDIYICTYTKLQWEYFAKLADEVRSCRGIR